MNSRLMRISGSLLTALTGLICLSWWLCYNPAADLILHVQGMDGRLSRSAGGDETIHIGEFFLNYPAAVPETPGSWPRFRGEDFDNISKETLPLAASWPQQQGPPLLWEQELGEGHAGAVILNSRVYLLDYREATGQDLLRCFSLAGGEELWSRGYRVNMKRNHGISRAVPAVTEDYVITIGPRCHVMCVDATNGDFRWGLDMEKTFATATPQWYTAQCPLIDGGTVILAPGGSVLLCGIDLATGKILWQTPNPRGWKMSHSSVMPMRLNGKNMYVYSALGGVLGVSAEPGEEGALLWENSAWDNAVVAPSPVVFPDGRVFLTAGYGAGSMLLKVRAEGDGFESEVIYRHSPREGLACEQQTPILWKDNLYGILPKDGGIYRTQFVCYDPAGSVLWASGKTNQFGLGPYLLADNKFYILSDDGWLIVLDALADEYKELGRARVMEARDAWAPLALSAGRLLLRDSRTLVCLDMRSRE